MPRAQEDSGEHALVHRWHGQLWCIWPKGLWEMAREAPHREDGSQLSQMFMWGLQMCHILVPIPSNPRPKITGPKLRNTPKTNNGAQTKKHPKSKSRLGVPTECAKEKNDLGLSWRCHGQETQ